MTFSLLGVLEPESTYLIVATTVYGVLDMYGAHVAPVPAWLVFVLWGLAVCVPRFIPSLKAMSQRPIAPVQIVRIGDTSFASPGYYNLILLAVAGSLGYYAIQRDQHRYKVTASLLVQGVLLPFAVRMYRSRLPVDMMLAWRSGPDDMGAFYLVASMYAGADLLRSMMFSSTSFTYGAITLVTRWSALALTCIIVMEACLLGCNTRLQIVAVLVPIALLIAGCPDEE